MGELLKILPGTGRGTAERSSVVAGTLSPRSLRSRPLHHAAHGSPPRSGEDLLSNIAANVHGRRMTISSNNATPHGSMSDRPSRARTRRTVNIVNFRGV